MPTISVVVLAYNRPEMLARALASVKAQRRAPDEVLVIDDHSEPALSAADVRLIRQATNQGAGAAAARGRAEARCEAIAFLNDDDVWDPEFLSEVDAALEAHPRAGIAFCDHSVIDHRGAEQPAKADEMSATYGRVRLQAGLLELARPALVDLSLPTASFSLVRREVLSPSLLRAGGDIWDYFVALAAVLSGRPGVYIDRRLGWYCLSPDGVSANWQRPELGISARARRVAAARIASRCARAREIRGTVTRDAFRNALGAAVLALRSRNPRMLAHAARELGQATLAPTRAPRRNPHARRPR